MSSNHFISAGSFRQPLTESQNRGHSDANAPAAVPHSQRDPVLLGDSVAIRRLRSQIQRIAPYFRTALIRGEVGSGKQLVGRAIHALSPGAEGPFIVIKSYALAESVANGDMARSSASPSPASLLESASGGTLYLDSFGELPFALQASLFRFIRACEERRAAPVASTGNSYRRPSHSGRVGP